MKNKTKRILAALLVVAAVLQTGMCLMAKPAREERMDIVEIAQKEPRLSTLVKALDSAGLVETLKGKGPFTVFAPTNEAFGKLPQGALEDLLKPENKGKLTDLLTYHVKDGKVLAEEALKLDGKEITMLNGKPAKLEVKDGNLFIDGAKVIQTDIQAKNGVIHIIDTVMMP